MKIFRNKILMKIIASICIVLTLMNCGTPYKVRADWEDILITPITKLLTTICDGIISLLHKSIQKQDVTLIELSGKTDWWEDWGEKALRWIVTALVLVIALVVIIGSGGAAAVAGGSVVGAVLNSTLAIGVLQVVTITLTGTGVGTLAGQFVAERVGEKWFSQGTIYLPAFTLTPEIIFSNKILLFDVNFFQPINYVEIETETETSIVKPKKSLMGDYDPFNPSAFPSTEATTLISNDKLSDWFYFLKYGPAGITYAEGHNYSMEKYYEKLAEWDESGVGIDEDEDGYWEEGETSFLQYEFNKILENIDAKLTSNSQPILNRDDAHITLGRSDETVENAGKETYYIIYIEDSTASGCERLFRCQIMIDAGVSFTDEQKEGTLTVLYQSEKIVNTVIETEIVHESTAAKLQATISKWYFILRNFALLALMVILVYIGIRIVIGSTAGTKAKYKERLMDWLVAMCLIFVMHYIMAFSVELIGKITEMIQTVKDEDGTAVYIPLNINQLKNLEGMEEDEDVEDAPDRADYEALKKFGSVVDGPSSTGKELMWTTDIMGRMRIMSQTTEEGTARWVGYALCYMVLVIFTIFFTWTYVKRVLYMAFLTLIAPLVAMTYPIDKMNDGKAQAFNTWLKEYIFNLLIQPMHLLLYTILVSSAYKLAVTSPIYAVVAIGFLVPAEKLVRSFFGFTKAKTAGALGGAAGAALAFTGMQSMMKFAKGKGNSKDDRGDKDTAKIKFASKEGVNAKETVAKSVEGKSKIKTATPKSAPETTPTPGAGQQTETAAKVRQQTTPTPAANQPATPTPAASQPTTPGAGKTATPKPGAKAKPADNAKAEEKKKAGKGKRIVRAVTGAGAQYGRQLQRRLVNRIHKARPIRAMARGVTGLAGATALGMTGLALGIASGDPSKAFQYTTAGVAGGYSAGKNIGGNAVDALSVNTEKIQEEMRMTYMGEDYKDFKFEESVDKMANNEGNINKVRKLTGLSYDESQHMLGTVGRRCMQSGIDNVEDMAAVYQMGQQGYTTDQAIAALKFNKYLPSDLNSMGLEERDDHIAQWAREYEEAGYENSTDLAEESMKLAETINKIKSDMKKADV